MTFLFTFSFDYTFVKNAYDEMLNTSHVFVAISGVKVVAIILLFLVWYNKFFKTMGEDGKKIPITPSDIYKGLLIISLVGIYDQILTVLDTLLGAIEQQYFADSLKVKPLYISNTTLNDANNPPDAESSMKAMSSIVVEIISDPFYIVLKLFESIFWLLDLILYGLFLAERFFFLGLLRVFGGLCIACMVVEKLEKWFWSWLSLYVGLYLVIIPYFLINRYTSEMYTYADLRINPGQTLQPDSLVMIVVLVFVVALKAKLFVKAQQILLKIFS